MKIDLLDLSSQYDTIECEIDSAIKNVLKKSRFILGENVQRLESDLAKYTGVKHAIGVANGTDALVLALKALGIKQGDEIITSPYTFFATAEAASILGATPVFADIDEQTLCLDPAGLEAKINSNTKAIIPVHIFGQVCNMERIMSIANKYGIPVVEDACQAIGSELAGKRAGSFGLAGVYSFFPSKNLGCCGDGGMLVTNNDGLAEEVGMLRVHGSRVKYVNEKIGYNSRLDEIQAAVLNVKLKYLDKWNEQRSDHAKYYTERLKALDIRLPLIDRNTKHTFHQYCIRVDASKRDSLKKFLQDKGIGTAVYYPMPLHLLPVYKELGGREGDFPIAESACKQTLALPIYPELDKEALSYVVDVIYEFFNM